MNEAYNPAEARDWILKKLEKKPFRAVEDKLSSMLDDFIRYDLHYMRVSGVLDENDDMGENEYDDDDAFEELLDVLGGDVDDEDEMNRLAQMLDSYMAAQQDFMEASGLME